MGHTRLGESLGNRKAPKQSEVPSGPRPPVRGNSVGRVSQEKRMTGKSICRPRWVGGLTSEMQISEDQARTHPQEAAI